MNNRAFTMSFVIAALAVMMIYSYVSSTESQIKEQYGPESSVVVAKKDIRQLDVFDETNLTIKTMPKTFAEPGTVSKIELLAGGLASAPIMAGEQITRSKVFQAGVQSGLARQVAIGKRAITVRVNDETGVAKLIKPGDRVDILANIDLFSGNKRMIETRTILQDVLILATGKYITNTLPGILEADPYKGAQKNVVRLNEYNSYSNVTVEADPTQVQMLVFTDINFGGVVLSLRNNDDNSREEIGKTMAEDLLGGKGASNTSHPATPPQRAPGGNR